MKISVVVPAYNEAVNIPFLVEEFDKFIKKHKNLINLLKSTRIMK
jgi:glycosyltransferase involved in cell wall biosynthesis